MSVKLDTVAKGLSSPWGMTFLPGGDFVYTDKVGKMYRQSAGKQTEVKGVPPVFAMAQGGLLDVHAHPNFDKNQLLYMSYAKVKDSAGVKLATTALMCAKLEGNVLKNGKDIFVALPWKTTPIHFGSRIEFDKEGKLFLTVGDRFQHTDTLPQKLDNDLGKIHRMNDDGTAPADNPFVNTPGARATIWTYGHRNPQSLSIHPETGALWENEHGPRGGDELNLIEKGKNYGWPVISYGINYNGKIMTPFTSKEGMEPVSYTHLESFAFLELINALKPRQLDRQAHSKKTRYSIRFEYGLMTYNNRKANLLLSTPISLRSLQAYRLSLLQIQLIFSETYH